ncbi:hypothetical protein [Lentzea sp. NEAU-D7]|uniref:hypothetical protein n=1 Tax=Lentzea sp. NEAU-D7 TaxID=2994667 RepID=UPI00224ACF7A|nr:hypothetical protein [Lentzea sp. NEAU-D7]MCX2954589.1 hypothetical protein [Lentzea sp. NEAU-D7]
MVAQFGLNATPEHFTVVRTQLRTPGSAWMERHERRLVDLDCLPVVQGVLLQAQPDLLDEVRTLNEAWDRGEFDSAMFGCALDDLCLALGKAFNFTNTRADLIGSVGADRVALQLAGDLRNLALRLRQSVEALSDLSASVCAICGRRNFGVLGVAVACCSWCSHAFHAVCINETWPPALDNGAEPVCPECGQPGFQRRLA